LSPHRQAAIRESVNARRDACGEVQRRQGTNRGCEVLDKQIQTRVVAVVRQGPFWRPEQATRCRNARRHSLATCIPRVAKPISKNRLKVLWHLPIRLDS